ncbi:Aspartic proteinase-like protein, partial [Thalictrum thalictroides]
ASATGKEVSCYEDFCTNLNDGTYPKCETEKPCGYKVLYADGSGTDGYYVRDYIQYNQASGTTQTSPGNASVVFGCGARQSGDLGSSSQELDGILGFGQSNTSVLSQLASSGKVKKIFSHCLDGQNGGGIFAIGQVVQPKVKTTPLVPDQPHYNVNLEEIVVGKDILDLPTDVFETGERKGTIIDSGTTLAYLPDVVYAPLINAIKSHKPDMQLITIEEQYQCFQYAGSVDDVFPTVTFHFKGSLTLMVYPHEYMFSTEVSREKLWCIGWQDGSLQSKDGKYMTLLGDIVLSNKLVVYDLENQTIGWTEYNCSSSIELLDDHSGAQYSVSAHDLSSASILEKGRISIFLLLSVLYVIYF